jgi:uncharacterized protein (DUF1800 family)
LSQFSRSNFLNILLRVPSGAIAEEQTSPLGLTPYSGAWGQAQILHLIRRTLFGVTQDDYKYFSVLTLEQSLDILLTQSPTPLPPVNAYNDEKYTDPDVPWGETWVYAGFGDPEGGQDTKRVINLKSWWVGLMLNQDRSLTEKMTLFWHNHLAAQMFLMKDSRLDYGYLSLLRLHALGNFKTLVREVTTNPGMLEYLNGVLNTAAAPNENYARELQELFTVGKGADSHYTEEDVKEAARVLTGWKTDDRKGGVFNLFVPANHDTGDKKFSAFYNHTVITGKKGPEGKSETDELVDMIFKQRETAKYLCRNVYRWFVNHAIDERIEANIINPLADVFIKNNFEIKSVLRALLGSEHFFDPIYRGAQIKNPVDHFIGICRQLYVGIPADLKQKYEAWYYLITQLDVMGMEPGEPPNVAGWSAYYQFPGFDKIWINSTTLTHRNRTTDIMGFRMSVEEVTLKFDLLKFTSRLSQPDEVNKLIAESTLLLSPVGFDASEVAALKSILLSGQRDDYYWSEAWNDYQLHPTDEIKINTVHQRLIAYYRYLLQRAECQLI